MTEEQFTLDLIKIILTAGFFYGFLYVIYKCIEAMKESMEKDQKNFEDDSWRNTN